MRKSPVIHCGLSSRQTLQGFGYLAFQLLLLPGLLLPDTSVELIFGHLDISQQVGPLVVVIYLRDLTRFGLFPKLCELVGKLLHGGYQPALFFSARVFNQLGAGSALGHPFGNEQREQRTHHAEDKAEDEQGLQIEGVACTVC